MPFKKIVVPAASTDDLIAQIERKDRRFRVAQTIFMVSTFVALIVVIFIQNQTLNGVKDQLTQAKMTADSQDQKATDARDKIIRRLDCIVVFFGQKDRTNLSIADIDRCTLNKDGNLQQFFTQNPNGTTTASSTEQPGPKAPAP